MDTVCISCAHATGECCWSRQFVPVAGWNALQTRNSYCVVSCPEYKADHYIDSDGIIHCRPLTNIDTDGLTRLLTAAMERTREDYLFGIGPSKDKGENRAALEAVIRSTEFCTLFLLDDPDALILALRKQLITKGVL